MHATEGHRTGEPCGLPKRFPVGTTYVVEGHGDEDGRLQVFSRYVLLPGGRRINLGVDFGGQVPARSAAGTADRRATRAGRRKTAFRKPQKIMTAAGTSRRRRR